MVDLKNILKLAKSSYKELIKENKQYITNTKQQQCWQQQQQQQYQQQKIYTRPKKYEKVVYEEQTESEAEKDQ